MAKKKSTSRKTGNQPSPTDGPVFIALEAMPARVAGARFDDDGVPTQRFIKGVIRDGTFIHPKTKQVIDVTPERRQKWADKAMQMLANGQDIEITEDHGIRGQRAGKIRGYVKDVFNEGNWLNVVAEMRGEDGIKLAETVRNVSVEIEDFEDGLGNKYEDSITNVSICEKPVITAQQGFKRIAASAIESDDDAPVYVSKQSSDPGESDMDKKLLSLIATITGQADLKEDGALSALTDWNKDRETKDKETRTKLSTLQTQLDDARKDDGAAPLKLSAIDADNLESMIEGTQTDIDNLLNAGHITPNVANKLSALFVGKDNERDDSHAICLSSAAAKRVGFPKGIAKLVLSILKENDPVVLKKKTGPQTVVLSRQNNGGEDDIEETTKRMTALANEGREQPQTAAA